jgi:aminopeptidase N
VIAAVGELDSALTRAVCWNTVIDMVQNAELSVPAFVAMLAHGIQRDPSVAVIQILSRQAELMMAQLADPAWVPSGKRQLAEVAEAMLRSAAPGGDHQLAWAQVLAWSATSSDQLDLVAGLLEGSAAVPGLTVNVELRWALLLRLAATARASEEQVATELAADATDAGARHAAACLAAMPDAARKEAAWQQLTGGELGVDRLVAVGRAFSLPEHAVLLTPYAERYLPAVEKIWATGSGHLRVLLGDLLVPYPAASAALTGLVGQIDDYLAASPRDPGLARVLVERRDTLARALLSRALPAGPSASA